MSQGNRRYTYSLAGRKFQTTDHAVARMLDMAVDAAEVVHALSSPVCVYPGVEGRTIFRGLRVTLPCMEEDGVFRILTCLWSRDQDWADDLSLGDYEGRVA